MKMSINDMLNERVQILCECCGAPDMVYYLDYLEMPYCENCGSSDVILDDPDFEDEEE